MSVYSIVSSLLSYVFTTIIYLFIFSVIGLIYMDIKKISRKEKNKKAEGEKYTDGKRYAVLRTLKSRKTASAKMKASYRIPGKGVIVGRGKDCDISINHMFLSTEHFQVWCDQGEWYIGDMGSKNGTFLNGSRVRKVKQLNDGDEIAFGELKVVFEEEE